MALTEKQLMSGLAQADSAGNAEDVEFFKTQIQSLRAGKGPPQDAAVPLGADGADPASPLDEHDPSADEDLDPLATIPTAVGGYELPQEVREAMLETRKIEDPKAQRMAQARIAGFIDANSTEGNAADKFNRSQAGAGVRAIGTGFFGIGDYANAAGQALGSDMSFAESLEAQRAYRHALEGKFTKTMLLGEIGGMLLTGSAALRAAKVVAGTGRAGKALKAATVFTKGGGAKGIAANALRASGAGALGAGFLEGVSEGSIEDAKRGAIVGGVAGPVGMTAVKVGGKVISAAQVRAARAINSKSVQGFLNEPAAKTIKVLAKKLGETPQTLSRRFLLYRAATGKNPSMAELANREAGAELETVIGAYPSSASIARTGKEALENVRGPQFAEGAKAGKLTTTKARQLEGRTRQGDKQFEEARSDNFTFEPEDVGLLEDLAETKYLGETLKKEIKTLLKDAVDENDEIVAGVTLDGKQFGRVYQDIQNSIVGKPTGSQREALEYLEVIADIGREQSPKFGKALDEYATRSAKAEGVAAGRKIVTQDASEAGDFLRNANQDSGAGARVGARTKISDVAARGYDSSVRVAQQLGEDSSMTQALKKLLPKKEFHKLQRAARLHAQGAESLERVAPAIRAQRSKAGEQFTKDALVGIQAATGQSTSAIVKAGIWARNISSYVVPGRLTKQSTENIARDLFDPSKTEAALRALRKAGMDEEDLLNYFIVSSVAGRTGAAAADQ